MYVSLVIMINSLFELSFFRLGLNGGVCRSTATGGVVCACPDGYTRVQWYVYKLFFLTMKVFILISKKMGCIRLK
jgi:hypothetical protein